MKRSPINEYDLFDKLKQHTSIKSEGEAQYLKMVQKGELDLGDYGHGFLCLRLYAYTDAKDKHYVRIYISNVDDGGYGAWSERETLEECVAVVEKAVTVFKDMTAFPSLDELNVLLRPFGVYVVNEG